MTFEVRRLEVLLSMLSFVLRWKHRELQCKAEACSLSLEQGATRQIRQIAVRSVYRIYIMSESMYVTLLWEKLDGPTCPSLDRLLRHIFKASLPQ